MRSSTGSFAGWAEGRSLAGAALLLTLGMIILMSGVVLAFLLMVRTEYGAAKGYEGGTNARLLADSALNLVIAQIREASTQPTQAWISQPGLMRTFDTNGKPSQSYKLYSADSLVEEGSFDPSKGNDLPAAVGLADPKHWKNQPGLWTDLNAPVADLSRADPFVPAKRLMIYPIFDGNHLNAAGQYSLNKTDADIEGFRVDEYASRGVTMPVKWLYLLKDGTLAPARAFGTQGDVEVVVPSGKEKTAQGEVNRPVARVAFWTDDETAKVNINTASEGTFWDTPVANSQPGMAYPSLYHKSSDDTMFEWDLAERQGAQKEFQRYPGHPATTCLSAIFGRQLSLLVGNDRAKMVEEINKFVPRVSGAVYFTTDPTFSGTPDHDWSSKGGTKRAGPEGQRVNRGQSGTDETTYPVTPDGDRLYATIDEFLFSPNFGTQIRTAWRLAPPAASSTRDTTQEMLEMSKFFLTASSKAPEQNLFNLPRISIWPEQVSANRRTAVDKLIAFCATVGPKTGNSSRPYYFTRQNANSSGLNASGAVDVQGDLSAPNLALMAYLKGLTGRPFPGWATKGAAATTFAAKYGADRNQILTEIFDYIRCTNLADRTDPSVPASYTQPEEFLGDWKTGYFLPDWTPGRFMGARGQVVPIEMPDGTRGMGRFATISELALVMIRKNDNATSARIEFSLLPKLFSPMAGFGAMANGLRITFKTIDLKVTEQADPKVTPTPVHYPFQKGWEPGMTVQPTLFDIGRTSTVEDGESKVGGTIGIHSLCQNGNGVNRGAPPKSVPPTGEIAVGKAGDTEVTIEGTVTAEISGPVKFDLDEGTGAPQRPADEPVLQTITFKFPQQKVPIPRSTGGSEIASGGTGSNRRGSRLLAGGWSDQIGLFGDDTVRSLLAVGNKLQGDMRLIAARKTVDDTYFAPAPNPNYADQTKRNNATHSLRLGWGGTGGAAFGYLVGGPAPILTAHYGDAPGGAPDIPLGITGVVNAQGQPGDWDNGPAFITDGPYCNKPDEGSKRHHHGRNAEGFLDYAETDERDISAPYIGYVFCPTSSALGQTTFFAPNRIIPSPVMFGSLPTGVMRNLPWQTLLFRPAKTYLPGGDTHPGSATHGPPDHLLLDLFWMPVAEPYAISEPFATGGKINLNQQIAPFTNIKRDTGLRAVLKSVKITALNPRQKDNQGGDYVARYKVCGTVGNAYWDNGGGRGVVVRRSIDLDNTLKQITDRQKRNKPFVSASEICDITLVPQDVTPLPSPVVMQSHVGAGFNANTPLAEFDAKLAAFWAQHLLTGDNSLEKPYAHIYPRLTTRSNSYTVHVRVQTLPQSTRNASFILKATQSQPTGEFRGSFLIERYLDGNTANFVDKAGNPVTPPANGDTTGLALGPYRFRVVSSKQFAP